jgi:hypothetical protein
MTLSLSDRELLQKAFKHIEDDEILARQVIDAAENKWWHTVGSIINSVLESIKAGIQFTIDAIQDFFDWL